MRSSLVVACAAAFSAAAWGQSIAGTVFDPLGAPVDQVRVQIKDSSGKAHTVDTSGGGKYSFTGLAAGKYDVAVNVPGLQGFQAKDLMVDAGKTLRFDIKLQDTTQLGTLGEDRLAVAASIGRHNPPSGAAPRTVGGKPDLSGLWWSPQITDPGKPEFLAWAEDVAKRRREENRKDSPQAHCLPSPVLRLGPLFELVQGQQMMILVSDDDSPGFHQIYLDGRQHPKDPNPAWYGHNIGRWDGDTLVIDRVGFDERVWLDQDSHPHSDKLHVVERYRRPDLGHLETEITVEDPGALARPYTFKRVAELAPSEELYEFICPENNRDAPHMVGK
jgi:carboxypeptidase family protein